MIAEEQVLTQTTDTAHKSGEVVLSVKQATKKMGNKTIVDTLSFDLRQGEIVGLLGPNGAGKTTTIRMIVGLIGMTAGDVVVKGTSIRQDFAKAIAEIGGIIENPEFYPYMTGNDNLKQYQRMSGGIDEARLQEVTRLVGLEHAIHKRVKTYSLGMRQRLGIAQALLHKPSILILDEPTNGLDPAGIREMRDYLKQIASEQGIAVLVSSHLLSEMELMCSRVVVIQEGKFVTERALGAAVGEPDAMRVNIILRVDDTERAKAQLVQMEDIRLLGLSAERGQITISVHDSDIPDIVNRFGNEGIRLYRIEEVKSSLEDEFLKWTGGKQHV
ncbi:ABC transporter ATP-binding protein [Paenibacillus senegalimassiliensis]|uniref:ABC transporter ATP-binding protein n=1 Tax=Paenibacillus senegalimassiliensis TaxID=1737426 RepID=UPI00073F76D7|nr:ABC transporter ATP-binding protein [Paenibacillus senegalimassiliensis]